MHATVRGTCETPETSQLSSCLPQSRRPVFDETCTLDVIPDGLRTRRVLLLAEQQMALDLELVVNLRRQAIQNSRKLQLLSQHGFRTETSSCTRGRAVFLVVC